MLDDIVNGSPLSVGKSVLSLFVWLLTIVRKSIHRQLTVPSSGDAAFGLTSDTAVSPVGVISKSCDTVKQILASASLTSLGRIACYEDTGINMVGNSHCYWQQFCEVIM